MVDTVLTAERLAGSSQPIQALRDTISTIARVSTTVLVEGETGSGKGTVAEEIHVSSPRAEQPFITVSCAGGGAVSVNSFLAAHRGTLFFDDVEEMKPEDQARVLRFLEERHMLIEDEQDPVAFDVRIIAASGPNLHDCVAQGTFRDDLYYRLAEFRLTVPTLRERAADIPVLFMRFLAAANERHNLNVPMPAVHMMRALTAYSWPGNVRQLRSFVEQFVVLNANRDPSMPVFPDLPPADGGLLESGIDLGRTLQEIERILIREALSHCDGNRARAARLLGLKRTTLIEKIKRLGGDAVRDDHSITLDPAFRPVIVRQQDEDAGSAEE